MGILLIAAAGLGCYALFRCARTRARDQVAAEMAQIELERAEIDAAAAAAAAAEAGTAGGGSGAGASATAAADRPKKGLKPALLARLPTFTYTEPAREPEAPAAEATTEAATTPDAATATDSKAAARTESGRRCTICMDPLAGARCATLPCGHIFHSECVLPWLQNEDASCPECRLDIAAVLDPRKRAKGG
jgi:Ring finger domain